MKSRIVILIIISLFIAGFTGSGKESEQVKTDNKDGIIVVDMASNSEMKEIVGDDAETEIQIDEETEKPKGVEDEYTDMEETGERMIYSDKETTEAVNAEVENLAKTNQTEESVVIQNQRTDSVEEEKKKEENTEAKMKEQQEENIAASIQEAEPEEQEEIKETEEKIEIDFQISDWISYARTYAEQIGLSLNEEAKWCWDTPIVAGAECIYLERDIQSRLDRYSKDEDITDVWIWAEERSDKNYDLYIGYA